MSALIPPRSLSTRDTASVLALEKHAGKDSRRWSLTFSPVGGGRVCYRTRQGPLSPGVCETSPVRGASTGALLDLVQHRLELGYRPTSSPPCRTSPCAPVRRPSRAAIRAITETAVRAAVKVATKAVADAARRATSRVGAPPAHPSPP